MKITKEEALKDTTLMVLVVVALLAVSVVAGFGVTVTGKQTERTAKYGHCGIYSNQVMSGCLRCENAGGIFFRGGWGTDRCDFPPNTNNTN